MPRRQLGVDRRQARIQATQLLFGLGEYDARQVRQRRIGGDFGEQGCDVDQPFGNGDAELAGRGARPETNPTRAPGMTAYVSRINDSEC